MANFSPNFSFFLLSVLTYNAAGVGEVRAQEEINESHWKVENIL